MTHGASAAGRTDLTEADRSVQCLVLVHKWARTRGRSGFLRQEKDF